MAKFSIKGLIHQLKEKFTHANQEWERTNEEYQKERKNAQGMKVNKSFGGTHKKENGNRDISAI